LSDLIRDRVFWKPRIDTEQRPAGSVEGGGFTVVSDMMSLVGCSGEEFEEILRSLGFRDQKRQVPKPAPFVAMPAVESVVADTPVEDQIEAAPETVAETPAETKAETEAELIVEAPAEPAAAPEMIDVNVWWPKDTGPFRKQPERKERPQFKKREFTPAVEGEAKPKFTRPDRPPRNKQKFDRKDRNGERPERNDRPPPRPEKPMDPNSPFAALLALKEQMKQR
jgi:ATP-dependent RNA helicase SUPV3L1/SUV3